MFYSEQRAHIEAVKDTALHLQDQQDQIDRRFADLLIANERLNEHLSDLITIAKQLVSSKDWKN
jgi:hypothetical protein